MRFSKYKAVKTVVDGITFASKREAYYYQLYSKMQESGLISELQLQPRFPFMYNNKKQFTYIADFSFKDDKGLHIVDVKGVETQTFKIKKKLIEAQYGFKIEVVK